MKGWDMKKCNNYISNNKKKNNGLILQSAINEKISQKLQIYTELKTPSSIHVSVIGQTQKLSYHFN